VITPGDFEVSPSATSAFKINKTLYLNLKIYYNLDFCLFSRGSYLFFFLKSNMGLITNDRCPAYSSFFGAMGATSAMVFTGKFNKTIY
jgi:hypothetical protein